MRRAARRTRPSHAGRRPPARASARAHRRRGRGRSHRGRADARTRAVGRAERSRPVSSSRVAAAMPPFVELRERGHRGDVAGSPSTASARAVAIASAERPREPHEDGSRDGARPELAHDRHLIRPAAGTPSAASVFRSSWSRSGFPPSPHGTPAANPVSGVVPRRARSAPQHPRRERRPAEPGSRADQQRSRRAGRRRCRARLSESRRDRGPGCPSSRRREIRDEPERRHVAPLQIVDDDHDRLLGREVQDEPVEAVENPERHVLVLPWVARAEDGSRCLGRSGEPRARRASARSARTVGGRHRTGRRIRGRCRVPRRPRNPPPPHADAAPRGAGSCRSRPGPRRRRVRLAVADGIDERLNRVELRCCARRVALRVPRTDAHGAMLSPPARPFRGILGSSDPTPGVAV